MAFVPLGSRRSTLREWWSMLSLPRAAGEARALVVGHYPAQSSPVPPAGLGPRFFHAPGGTAVSPWSSRGRTPTLLGGAPRDRSETWVRLPPGALFERGWDADRDVDVAVFGVDGLGSVFEVLASAVGHDELLREAHTGG